MEKDGWQADDPHSARENSSATPRALQHEKGDDFIQRSALNAAASMPIRSAIRQHRQKHGELSRDDFASQLKLVAQMISAGIPAGLLHPHWRFDTHAGQEPGIRTFWAI